PLLHGPRANPRNGHGRPEADEIDPPPRPLVVLRRKLADGGERRVQPLPSDLAASDPAREIQPEPVPWPVGERAIRQAQAALDRGRASDERVVQLVVAAV